MEPFKRDIVTFKGKSFVAGISEAAYEALKNDRKESMIVICFHSSNGPISVKLDQGFHPRLVIGKKMEGLAYGFFKNILEEPYEVYRRHKREVTALDEIEVGETTISDTVERILNKLHNDPAPSYNTPITSDQINDFRRSGITGVGSYSISVDPNPWPIWTAEEGYEELVPSLITSPANHGIDHRISFPVPIVPGLRLRAKGQAKPLALAPYGMAVVIYQVKGTSLVQSCSSGTSTSYGQVKWRKEPDFILYRKLSKVVTRCYGRVALLSTGCRRPAAVLNIILGTEDR